MMAARRSTTRVARLQTEPVTIGNGEAGKSPTPARCSGSLRRGWGATAAERSARPLARARRGGPAALALTFAAANRPGVSGCSAIASPSPPRFSFFAAVGAVIALFFWLPCRPPCARSKPPAITSGADPTRRPRLASPPPGSASVGPRSRTPCGNVRADGDPRCRRCLLHARGDLVLGRQRDRMIALTRFASEQKRDRARRILDRRVSAPTHG